MKSRPGIIVSSLSGGFTIIAGISLLLSLMLSLHSSIPLLAVLYAFLMIGIGCIMTPVTAYAMSSVSVQMIAHASPMTISIHSIASSLGGVSGCKSIKQSTTELYIAA